MQRAAAAFALCLALFVFGSEARFVIEKGGLQIRLPASAKQQYPNGFDMSLANFGAPKYGGQLVGELIYVESGYYAETVQCSPACKYACQDFAQAQPAFNLKAANTGETYIMLVDRGPVEVGMSPCKFAQKVWNAQQAGAQGVIVVNYDEKHTTMEAPDDQDDVSYMYLTNITIPAAFITKSDGQHLKDLLKISPGQSQEPVLVMLDWTDVLPRAETVEWEFWTNSNDMCGPVCDVQKEFIREFAPVAKELEGNWTRFSPHYIVWICPEPYRDSEECRSQCIHHGRYCTPDPDGDLQAGYDGSDIVQENLRQLCVFKLANESSPPRPWVWWDYSTRFADNCKMSDNKYNEACAEQVFQELGGNEWSSLQALRDCIGDPTEDTQNAIMEEEMASQRGNTEVGEVYILPTIRINQGQYRGKLSYVEVLRALCAGFNVGNEPTPCLRVAEDNCRPGGKGAQDCSFRTDGKTKCENTFAGYSCTCGDGYISHTEPNGTETCLNFNECLNAEWNSLDPDCTCERCACIDTPGSYTCQKDLADECAVDHGGCWYGTFSVKGKDQEFSACQDNLKEYQNRAARGLSLDSTPLHVCACPACFTEMETPDGKRECVPKCDLDFCDQGTGVCMEAQAAAISGSALSGWGVVLIVFGSLGAAALAGYAAYRLRLRSAMHQEIRAIMAQYMPLENQDGASAGGTNGRSTMSVAND